MNSLFTPLSWGDTGYILTGVMNTVTISVLAIVVGTLLGLMVGFTRAESNKVVNVVFGVCWTHLEACRSSFSWYCFQPS